VVVAARGGKFDDSVISILPASLDLDTPELLVCIFYHEVVTMILAVGREDEIATLQQASDDC